MTILPSDYSGYNKTMFDFNQPTRKMCLDSLYVARMQTAFVYGANLLGWVPDEVVCAYDRMRRRVRKDRESWGADDEAFVFKPSSPKESVARAEEADRWAAKSKKYLENGELSLCIVCAHRGHLIGDHHSGLTDEVIKAYNDLVKEVEEISAQTTTGRDTASENPLQEFNQIQ